MTPEQTIYRTLLDKQSQARQRMAEIAALSELSPEVRSEVDTLESGAPDVERQLRACRAAMEDAETESIVDAGADAPETRAERKLRGRVQLSSYIGAAMDGRAVAGAEAELNQHLGLPGNRFPLDILAPVEMRATTDTDAAAGQMPWVDRLFVDTAAMRLGISMKSVMHGVTTVPVTTAGASAAQRGRGEAAADTAWTVGVTELSPKRNSVRAVFSEEDAMRLPGLEDGLRRDLGKALSEGIDEVIFVGDDGANETRANIAGLTTVTGVTEYTLSQANKLKAQNTLSIFLGLVDGKHAGSLGDLGVVTSVGANTLWGSTIANSTAENQTLAQFLMASGLSWMARGDIDTATTNGKFGAFIGAQRNIEGAGCAAVWNSAQLVRDVYSGAASGEVALTLSYFWDLAFPRASHFSRLKFVT